MEFGVLKAASVISKGIHNQESHLKVLTLRSFTNTPCKKQYSVIAFGILFVHLFSCFPLLRNLTS